MDECTQKAAQNVKRGEVYGFRFFLSIGFDQIDMYECGMYDAQFGCYDLVSSLCARMANRKAPHNVTRLTLIQH